MSKVVLLSTRKLPPTYFDQVREDLGDQDITIDVVGWVAPSAWVADKVNTFTLIGPGRMPAEPAPEETVVEEKPAEVEAEKAPTPAAPTPTPPPAAPTPKPKPTGAKRVVKAVEWRARRAKKVAGRMLPKAIKTSAPVKFLRGQRATSDLGKTYWERVLSRRDVLSTIDQADVVIALDAGAIWAGWNLGQRKASTPVVLGLPAARRELDMMKVPSA
ncbi:hypothetical protein [Kribbella speibonae]|uniref:Uncharacterized protein n=1 Tax=Kribbella speibonae TaxID=1572660 RepID=A0A4V2M3E2_9ACTN|nr:hypothetical protein [Kribbella speibonae]TCC19634.1 hypothetical protein E0H58_32635 [Kribbella speibonae]TCC31712.1 hypothetical protein E0H92_34795 [Kribbella speibonae]